MNVRKILNKNSKSKRLSGTRKGRIGTPLNIMDKNRNALHVGDRLRYSQYVGVLLYNESCDQYGVCLEDSMWYGENKYDTNAYGKFVSIPMDNGGRMEIEKLDEM